MTNVFISRLICFSTPNSQNGIANFTRISSGIIGNSRSSVNRFSSSSHLKSEETKIQQPSSSAGEVSIQYRNRLPVITLPLPSRHENCQFVMKPVSHTVADFCDHVKAEDKGVDIVSIYDSDGTKISNSTQIEQLLQLDQFQLRINDKVFLAEPPTLANIAPFDQESSDVHPVGSTTEELRRFDQVQAVIGSLHGALNVEEYQLKVERELVKRLEEITTELEPLERRLAELKEEAELRATRFLWVGLAAMGLQIGIFGRLTWWEYSWDIMEPVTYFATYSTAIACFAYYLVTRQTYEYHEAKDRLFLLGLHGKAKKVNFNIEKYNKLAKAKTEIEHDLKRIRDPFYLHLPLSRVLKLKEEREKDYAY